MSGLGMFSFLTVVFILLLGLLSVLIVYTPIRNVLPGYSASIRQQLVDQSARVDSMQTTLALQRRYLDAIKQVAAGEIPTDSVQRLDSLQVVQRAELLEGKSEAVEEFVARYEEKEHGQLMMLDPQSTAPVQVLVRPVRGVVTRHADMTLHDYGVQVRAAKNEAVAAVLRGTVVYMDRELDNTWTVVLQHVRYVSTYRHLNSVFKTIGARVEAGDALGTTNGEQDVVFELWKGGEPVNPEEVIVW
jgi:murein DD-endopeptidase MepM/ murein hydrolase activator NlpD